MGLSNPIIPDRSAEGEEDPYRAAVSFNHASRAGATAFFNSLLV